MKKKNKKKIKMYEKRNESTNQLNKQKLSLNNIQND